MNGDALTTKERIKDRLAITSTDWDNFFDNLILSITARIQQMTGRRFIQATYTNELHDGTDLYASTRRRFLVLKNGPVQSVSSVQYNTGTPGNPTWTTLSSAFYNVDLSVGAIHFADGAPFGYQNIRVTYTGGFSGYSIGVNNFWFFNVTPTGTVNGSNRTFTLSETADQVIVYVDGVREVDANVTHTNGTNTFTLAAGRAPYTTIAVDYLRSVATSDADYHLPADLVEVCERVVVATFKRRESEGKSNESFAESSITWKDSLFNNEDLATIKNYRRGYSL